MKKHILYALEIAAALITWGAIAGILWLVGD